MAATHDTLLGTYIRTRWRANEADSNPHVIGYVHRETEEIDANGRPVLEELCVQGPDGNCEIVPGINYEFYGKWKDHPTHGRSFHFTVFVVKIPHSEHGVIEYLKKYCHGVGTATARRMWDKWGGDAVKTLRTMPEVVAAHPPIARVGFTLEKAREAAAALTVMADLEDTKIGLTNLFAGRGFPGSLVDECVKRWKVAAPRRIQRDPFTLLVAGLSGCGFARCDKLYMDLALPPEKLKRQMICLWHVLKSDSSGNTWVTAERAVERLKQLVSGAKIESRKAVKLGIRSRWIVKRRDEAGVLWLAEGERGRNEAFVASQLKALGAWTPANGVELMTLIAASEGIHQMEPVCA